MIYLNPEYSNFTTYTDGDPEAVGHANGLTVIGNVRLYKAERRTEPDPMNEGATIEVFPNVERVVYIEQIQIEGVLTDAQVEKWAGCWAQSFTAAFGLSLIPYYGELIQE
jgi:hypothetical protein